MLNFDVDSDGHSDRDGVCKQALTDPIYLYMVLACINMQTLWSIHTSHRILSLFDNDCKFANA